MIVNFPANCSSEASRWSFCIKLNEKLRIWHNGECAGMTGKQAESWRKSNFYPRINAVMQARSEQIEIARIGAYWNPKIPDHVSKGVINYPSGLNQDNEGSRAVFLFGLMDNLKDKISDNIDVIAIQNALAQTKADAISSQYWNPGLEVIV